MTVTDFKEHFARARKLETLNLMVQRLVRDMRLRYNPEINSLKVTADSYRRLGNKRAADMFAAAAQRKREIEGAPAKAQVARPKMRKQKLENEMAVWFAAEMRQGAV